MKFTYEFIEAFIIAEFIIVAVVLVATIIVKILHARKEERSLARIDEARLAMEKATLSNLPFEAGLIPRRCHSLEYMIPAIRSMRALNSVLVLSINIGSTVWY